MTWPYYPIYAGSAINALITTIDFDGDPTDPSVLTVTASCQGQPEQINATWTNPSGDPSFIITRTDVGEFTVTFVPNSPGTWVITGQTTPDGSFPLEVVGQTQFVVSAVY